MCCAIRYYLYNSGNAMITPPKLHKQHQIAQLITYSYILGSRSFG